MSWRSMELDFVFSSYYFSKHSLIKPVAQKWEFLIYSILKNNSDLEGLSILRFEHVQVKDMPSVFTMGR